MLKLLDRLKIAPRLGLLVEGAAALGHIEPVVYVGRPTLGLVLVVADFTLRRVGEVAIDVDGLVAEDVAELAQRGRQMDLAEAVALVEGSAADFDYRVGDDDFGHVGTTAEGLLADFPY